MEILGKIFGYVLFWPILIGGLTIQSIVGQIVWFMFLALILYRGYKK